MEARSSNSQTALQALASFRQIESVSGEMSVYPILEKESGMPREGGTPLSIVAAELYSPVTTVQLVA
jgi:hypothetical protein